MIECDSDDERKARVHLVSGSSKTLMSRTPLPKTHRKPVAIREVWTHGKANLKRPCQSPQVQDEIVAGPRLCDESRFVEHIHDGRNHHVDHATTSSCSLVWKA